MESFEEKQHISTLLDIYGGLLTERQQSFIRLHYDEDLSYGEIAENEKISRQAVHDTIQHGKKALFRFEDELHLSTKNAPQQQDSTSSESESNDVPVTEIKQIVRQLCQIVQDDILYETDTLKSKLYKLRDLLKDK